MIDISRYLQRWSALQLDRSSWVEHWRDLGKHLQPRRPRFTLSERNKGSRKNENIINNTPLMAVRTLASGMMSGITSPARPWFRLGIAGEYGQVPGAKAWLHEVEQLMSEVMTRSNLYNALPLVYTDLGVFGTAAMVVEEDDDDVIRCYVLPVGQYAVASGYRLQVDTIYREMILTTAQLVQRFGINKVPTQVKEAFQKGKYDDQHEVIHVVEPRYSDLDGEQKELEGNGYREEDMNVKTGSYSSPMGQDSKKDGEMGTRDGVPYQNNSDVLAPDEMPWKSCWFLPKTQDGKGHILHEGGFNEWPVMVVRWELTGEDVYGSSPGMNALGDAQALQLYEKRKAQAVDKIVSPPMKGSASLRNTRPSLLPGDITYLDSVGTNTMFEPALTIDPQTIGVVTNAIKEHESRIQRAFYADLWLAITNDDRTIPATAREIVERHEEKMLQLGPTLERIQDELLDPLVERIFNIMTRRGLIPPPPREIENANIKVEYISVMSKAQKLVGTSALERTLQVIANIAPVKPDVVDKVNFDAVLEEYGDMVGISPKVIRPQGEVDRTRQQRAQQQQAMVQQQQGAMAAQNAKTLADTTLDQDNALSRLMGGIGAAPAGGGGGLPQ